MAGIGINTSFRFWTEDFRHSIMYFFSPKSFLLVTVQHHGGRVEAQYQSTPAPQDGCKI